MSSITGPGRTAEPCRARPVSPASQSCCILAPASISWCLQTISSGAGQPGSRASRSSATWALPMVSMRGTSSGRRATWSVRARRRAVASGRASLRANASGRSFRFVLLLSPAATRPRGRHAVARALLRTRRSRDALDAFARCVEAYPKSSSQRVPCAPRVGARLGAGVRIESPPRERDRLRAHVALRPPRIVVVLCGVRGRGGLAPERAVRVATACCCSMCCSRV